MHEDSRSVYNIINIHGGSAYHELYYNDMIGNTLFQYPSYYKVV